MREYLYPFNAVLFTDLAENLLCLSCMHALPHLFQNAANPPIDFLARAGYAARGVVYGLIGIFALFLSIGMGGSLTDTKGIFQRLLEQPLGKAFLIALGFGLFCYAIWRILQAVGDYDHDGKDLKGITKRGSYLFRGLLHAALGFSAWNLALHLADSGGTSESKIARILMSQAYGNFLVGALGLVIIAVGIGQIFIAYREKFTKDLQLPRGKNWLCTVCKVGIISRGIVFMIAGWLFLRTALHRDSSEAAGLRGVWKFLLSLPYGDSLVLALAAGLIAFSAYAFTQAVYRKRVG